MIFLVVGLMLLALACKEPWNWAGANYVWWLRNNSDRPIEFMISLKPDGDHVALSTQWPEIILGTTSVCPQEEGIYGLGAHKFDHDIGKTKDSFAVYVFDPDTLVKYTFDEIARDSNYLKRYLFRVGSAPGNPGNPIIYP